jgi:hypothetical protein
LSLNKIAKFANLIWQMVRHHVKTGKFMFNSVTICFEPTRPQVIDFLTQHARLLLL